MSDARWPFVVELASGRTPGPDTIVAQSLLAIAALAAAVFFIRSQRCAATRARDAVLLVELRRSVHAGKFPEARDRAMRADGLLARVVASTLRFPHGTHRDAIARAAVDAVSQEPPPRSGVAMLLPLCAVIAAIVGGIALFGRPALFSARDVVALQSFMTALVVVGVVVRIAVLSRLERRRVEHDAAEFAATVARSAESPGVLLADQSAFSTEIVCNAIAAVSKTGAAPESAAAGAAP